jgi:hypothetical protein
MERSSACPTGHPTIHSNENRSDFAPAHDPPQTGPHSKSALVMLGKSETRAVTAANWMRAILAKRGMGGGGPVSPRLAPVPSCLVRMGRLPPIGTRGSETRRVRT